MKLSWITSTLILQNITNKHISSLLLFFLCFVNYSICSTNVTTNFKSLSYYKQIIPLQSWLKILKKLLSVLNAMLSAMVFVAIKSLNSYKTIANKTIFCYCETLYSLINQKAAVFLFSVSAIRTLNQGKFYIGDYIDISTFEVNTLHNARCTYYSL